jgi:hypothetical protein
LCRRASFLHHLPFVPSICYINTVDVRSPERVATIFYGSELRAGETHRWVHEILDQCLHALDRLVRLSRWLQLHELVSDHFVILHVNSGNQVEAVQVPLSFITRLETCVADTIASSDYTNQSHVEILNAAAIDVLRLVSTSYNVSSRATEFDGIVCPACRQSWQSCHVGCPRLVQDSQLHRHG